MKLDLEVTILEIRLRGKLLETRLREESLETVMLRVRQRGGRSGAEKKQKRCLLTKPPSNTNRILSVAAANLPGTRKVLLFVGWLLPFPPSP